MIQKYLYSVNLEVAIIYNKQKYFIGALLTSLSWGISNNPMGKTKLCVLLVFVIRKNKLDHED